MISLSACYERRGSLHHHHHHHPAKTAADLFLLIKDVGMLIPSFVRCRALETAQFLFLSFFSLFLKGRLSVNDIAVMVTISALSFCPGQAQMAKYKREIK